MSRSGLGSSERGRRCRFGYGVRGRCCAASGRQRAVVNVVDRAPGLVDVPGGAWGYHDAERGRRGYLAPCGDAKAAAEQVEDLLKHRMFPGTW